MDTKPGIMSRLEKTAFWAMFGVAEIFGVIIVALMCYWTAITRGGFAWQENPGKQFNWHPLLMTVGLIYLYGNGMLLYRVFRNGKKKNLKILHATVMIGSFVCMTVGLKAAFDSHDLKKPTPIPNMYSLHSWMGIIAAALFAMQWVAGFMLFLVPNAASRLKAMYLNVHVWFGTFIFILSCATALLGVTEKMLFVTIFAPEPLKGFYQRKDPEGLMMNTTSLLIIIFAALVVSLTTNAKYKRMPLPEETQINEKEISDEE